MWTLFLTVSLAPVLSFGDGPAHDDLGKLLEQEYQELLKKDPRPELVRQAAHHFSAAARTWDYRSGLTLLRQTRAPAAVPLLLKQLRQRKPNDWKSDEFLLTLGTLTGENPRQLMDEHDSVDKLIRDWWLPNKSKITTDLDKMSPAQIEQCLFYLLDRVENDGDRNRGGRSDGDADGVKQSLDGTASFGYTYDPPSWNETELHPAMRGPLLRLCGYHADGKAKLDNFPIRFAAIPLLAALRNNGEAPELGTLAGDDKQPMALRWVCLLALSRAGEDVALDRVLQLLDKEKRLEGRLTGLLFLSDLDPSAKLEKTLLAALLDPNRHIRTAAIYALEAHPAVAALPNLQKMLRDTKETRVHRPILNIIAQMGSDEAKKCLAQTLERALTEKSSQPRVYDVLHAFQTAVGQSWIEAGAHDDAYYRGKAKLALAWWKMQDPGAPQDDAAKTLQAYYERKKGIDYQAALKKLATAGAAESDQIAAWLRALLAQAVKDEKSGEAPWEATPFFGQGGQNPARELRKWIAIDLGRSEALPAALPVLRWFFDEEFMPAFQLDAATALAKLKGKEAADLRAQLATRPHPNLLVVLTALKQIGAAKETLPADKLHALCHHHRLAIRDAARALAQQQGAADPGPFDPVKAMRSPGIKDLMKKLGGMFIDLPPADAPFIAVTPNNPAKVGRGPTTIKGWLIKEDADKVEFFSQFGWKESLSPADCKVARPRIEDEVEAIEKVRKDGDKGFQFSENGALSGQFRGRAASLTELMLAERLFAAGKLDLASRVLFPALETLYRDEEAVDVARHELGRVYGYEMLAAFAGDRDYQRTAKLATALAKHYPDTAFHEVAVGLAAQLPKRGGDFTKLKLPTPPEWDALKKKLTRAEQIDFLCERMRLLNCFQEGQPAGIELSQKQFAEPCGIARDASWGRSQGKTETINPLMVLRGPYGWFQGKLSSSDDADGRAKGMKLTLNDVPQLSNYLRDDWFMPTVTFWRDFHPARELHSTRPLFAHIINKLAGKDLCEIDRWRKLKPAAIDMEIERIARWAEENAEKTPLELEWIGLEELLAKGATWLKVKDRVAGLLKLKQPRAFDVMKGFLQDEKTAAWDKYFILEVYRKQVDLDWAAKDLEHKNDAVRICAAVVVFRSNQSAKAREILGDALEKRGLEWWTGTAVEALLAEGSKGSRRQVARLFAYKDMHLQKTLLVTPVFRGDIMRKCADAGMVEPYQYYLKQLDNNALVPIGPGNPEPGKLTWAELHVAEIWREFGSSDAAVKEISSKFRTNAEQLPAMKMWLQRRIAEMGGPEKQCCPQTLEHDEFFIELTMRCSLRAVHLR